MARLFWQAELYRNGQEYDVDFEWRETAAAALEDGRLAMARFTPAEREFIEYRAAEFTWDEDGLAENTGRVATEDPQ